MSIELSPKQRREDLSSPEKERHYLFIGINGATGVGKSTLAGLLTEKFGVTVFEEQFRKNPYLEAFYAEPAKWSFQSQCFFIGEKMEQMSKISKLLETEAVIVDPTHWQDAEIYAWVQHQMGWMTDKEYNTYFALYEVLSQVKKVSTPDIVISVHAPAPVIIQRIRERGREYESRMLENYPNYFPLLARRTEEWAQENPHQVPTVIVDAYEENYADDSFGIFNVMAQTQRKVHAMLGDRKDIILPAGFKLGEPIEDPRAGNLAKFWSS